MVMQNPNNDYYNKYLQNHSLTDLPGEQWKPIHSNDHYAVSNYGRIKSFARLSKMGQGRTKLLPEKILKLFISKSLNKYLNQLIPHVFTRLSKHGIKQSISISRLVYFHFVEEFNMDDLTLVVSHKDGDPLHLFQTNLELLTISEQKFKMFRNKRAESWKAQYKESIAQFDINGVLINTYPSIYEASKITGINNGSIYYALEEKCITAGGYRWFPAGYKPSKKDFKLIPGKQFMAKEHPLNLALWEKLGQPSIDPASPPALLNLSLKNLPSEKWKDIPGYEGLYKISNKGRVKKLAGLSQNKIKIFSGEQIMRPKINLTKSQQHFNVVLRKNQKRTNFAITRLAYYCFVRQFDLSDQSLVVTNKNTTSLKILPSNLILKSLESFRTDSKR